MAYLRQLGDLDNSHFVPDYDPSSTSQSSKEDEWVVLDEIGSDHSSLEPGAQPQEHSTSECLNPEAAPVVVTGSDTQMSVPRASCSGASPAHSRSYHCPLCGTGMSGHVKRHVLRKHLPWFWIGNISCWECRQLEGSALSLTVKHTMAHKGQQRSFDDDSLHEWCQMFNGSLHLLREWFGAEELLGPLQVMANRVSIPGWEFTIPELQPMAFYCSNYCDTRPHPSRSALLTI